MSRDFVIKTCLFVLGACVGAAAVLALWHIERAQRATEIQDLLSETSANTVITLNKAEEILNHGVGLDEGQ